MQRSKLNHYRDPGIDNWQDHNIKYVKFALYEERSEVAYVIFNASGSNMNKWFHSSRVVSSSWPDLTATAAYNYFSIAGDERYQRRFYINIQYTGCSNDLGYVAVKEALGAANCYWDRHSKYPQFLYSKMTSAEFWNQQNYGRADYLAVFVNI